MGEGGIRGYAERDREAVRRICFETGYMGEPVAWQWRDQESFADLFSAWYTDHEPESAWIAEVDGRAAGYLLGCRDSTRIPPPGQLAAHHLLRRALLMVRAVGASASAGDTPEHGVSPCRGATPSHPRPEPEPFRDTP